MSDIPAVNRGTKAVCREEAEEAAKARIV